jgi:hypothetical protein
MALWLIPAWAAPDEEVFAFLSDLVRPIGMYRYHSRA